MDNKLFHDALVERTTNGIYESISKLPYAEDKPSQRLCEKAAKECISNKQSLIEMLSKHPMWDEKNLRIHFSADFEREADYDDAVDNLVCALTTVSNHIGASIYSSEYSEKHFVVNEDGEAGYDDEYKKLYTLFAVVRAIYQCRCDFCSPTLSETSEAYIKNTNLYSWHGDFMCEMGTLADAHVKAGMKSTRAIMRLLTQYGFDDLPADIKHKALGFYSQYADAMCPIKIKRHTVLSVNPVDFLNMSVGNSWTSCHNIYNQGCYCGGCWSYAYDGVTMIFYTVDAEVEEDDITTAGKVTRQLYFWNDSVLIGSRVYPANDDTSSQVYTEQREIVEKIIADCLGENNLWKRFKEKTYITSLGYHYPDYNYHSYPAFILSTHNDDDDVDGSFTIGSDDPFCVICGSPLNNEEYPICTACAGHEPEYHCGCCGYESDDEDDFYWIESEDRYVCSHCFDEIGYISCDNCGDYVHPDNIIIVANNGSCYNSYYCENCVEGGYVDVAMCEDCGEYYRTSDMVYVEGYGYYCTNCADENLVTCDECGGLIHKADAYAVVPLINGDLNNPARILCADCAGV